MKKEGYFLIAGVVLLNLLVIILFVINNPFDDTPFLDDNLFNFFVRLFSLLGLVALFVSSMFTPFQKELYQMFKKPFIKIHHSTTISGLVLITLHPVTFAISKALDSGFVEGLKVFLPVFTTAYDFWSLAGRPALIIFYIALIGVLIRKSLKKGWRWIHGLNYIALVFGVIHGILIGSDFYNFQDPIIPSRFIITILFLLMTITTIATFTIKRMRMSKRTKGKKIKSAVDDKKETKIDEKDEELDVENQQKIES